jgi:hypothetical protein
VGSRTISWVGFGSSGLSKISKVTADACRLYREKLISCSLKLAPSGREFPGDLKRGVSDFDIIQMCLA